MRFSSNPKASRLPVLCIVFRKPGDNISVSSMNLFSGVAGQCMDSAGKHGCVRSPQGAVSLFDPSVSTFTQALGVNLAGETAGYYLDPGNISHAYVRSPQGAITSFDAGNYGTLNRRTAMPERAT